ncbi:CrcB family protein [Halovivax gelatinilyticus]|uniref:CrcB family protein n=1 Tax=Halovivax gelatinilyticus TaxID=2961597 RepID=UPI0020CA743C|nr:CrcB family protein [Halovivax gelatinilyticus]
MSLEDALARFETLAIVGIGGFAGANLRFFAVDAWSSLAGILVANVLGSLVLGFLIYEARYAGIVDRKSRLLFTTGFLSSLTTYSGFAFYTADAATAGPGPAVAFVGANYGLAIGAVLLGRWLAGAVRGDGA